VSYIQNDDKFEEIKIKSNERIILFFAMAVLGLHTSSCGILFGSSQEIDTKSHDYSILKLNQDPAWKPVHDIHKSESPPADREDIAFENTQTKAVISLNSDCTESKTTSLETLSSTLVLGLTEVEQKRIEVDHVPAIETTLETSEPNSPQANVRIRTIVLRKSGCSYDFMYIAAPSYFDRNLEDFNRFVKGFHAR
jgi:hypothetical protein